MPLASRQGPGNANEASTRAAKYLAKGISGTTLPASISSTGNHFNSQALNFTSTGNLLYIGQSNVANCAASWAATGGNNSQNGGQNGNLWLGNTGQWTIEGWFYFTTVPSTNTGIIEFGTGGLTIGISNTARIFTARTNQGYDANFNWTGGTGLSSNTWTHIAVQRSAYSGNTVQTAWINGNIANNAPITITSNYTGTNPQNSINTPYLGGGQGSANLIAQAQELRISNIARYAPTGNITVPAANFVNDPNTLLLIHGSSATTDDNS